MQKYFWGCSEIPPSFYELTLPQIRNICGHQVHELSKLKYMAFRRDLESDRKIHCLVAREKRAELTALVLNWLWPCPLVPKMTTTQIGLWEEAGCVGESTRIEIRRMCSQSWDCRTSQFSVSLSPIWSVGEFVSKMSFPGEAMWFSVGSEN